MTTLQRTLLTGGFWAAICVAHAQTPTPGTDRAITTEPVEISATRLPSSAATTSQVDLSLSNSGASATSVADNAANFYVGSSGARSFTDTFELRGLTNTPLFGDPAVTVYLDDMPLASGFTFPSDLVGFNSAELYRGPGQNTRFGRAGTVGVLQFSTASVGGASLNELRVHFGNDDDRGFTVQGSGSAQGLDVYAAAGYEARKGYITNTYLNDDIDGRESTSGLVRLHFGSPQTGDWTLLTTAQRVRDGVQPLVPLAGPKFSVDRTEEGITHLEDYGVSLRGSFDTDLGKLSATTSYTDWRLGPATNALNFGFAELEDNSILHEHAWTEEITLVSGGNSRWHGSAGLFALDGKTNGAFIRAFSGSIFEESDYTIDHESLAGFGETDFKLTPDLTLTAGMRLEGNWKKLERQEIVPSAGNAFDRSVYSSAFLPKLVATYRVDADTEASLGGSTGYKPGGFSAFTGNPALANFGAERLQGVEAAITRTDHHAWSATVRGFAYWISGYQIERSFKTGAEADDYIVVNAPHARSVGAELELKRQITEDWSAGGEVGLTNVTLREFRDPYTQISYDGKRAPYAPVYDANVHLEYRNVSGWFGRGEVVATGRTFYTESEDPMFSQSSYTLLNARAGYETPRYRVMLYGDNLTNREYFSAITPGTGHGTPGAPRTYGIETDWKF